MSHPLRLAELDFIVILFVLVAKLDSTVRLLLISGSTDNLRFYTSSLSLYWLLYLLVTLHTRPYCIVVYSVLGVVTSYAHLCPYLGNRFLHSPLILRIGRCGILVYSVLCKVTSYTLTMPCLGNRFLHSPVALHTRRYCILVDLVL